MWLLHCHTLQLQSFVSPEAVKEGYSILSHVWNADEQSFQDIQRIHERCAVSGEDARGLVSEKIRLCCELAERHGHKWVWIDTCCIDKTSSAELSEAINSMFRYYALARTCYAYLQDVSATDSEGGRPLAQSRWHKRGWTLQELLAPQLVVFLSGSWDLLGSKADLADELQDITGIPSAVLRGQRRLSDTSVAQRLSWAAERETTRIEDEAYSLLGIFDVNMPTLYGEGRKAFQRLQEEIMRQSPDTTLFAWGLHCGLNDIQTYMHHGGEGLFATSPSQFRSHGAIKCDPDLIAEKPDETATVSIVSTNQFTPPLMLGNTRSSLQEWEAVSCPSTSLLTVSLLVSLSSRSMDAPLAI